MERPPRRRDEKILSLAIHPARLFRPRQLVAFSCYATYYYMGWVLGAWQLWSKFCCHARVAARVCNSRERLAGLFANLDRLLFPDRDHADRQRAVQALMERRRYSRQTFLNPAHRREALKAIATGGRSVTPALFGAFVAPLDRLAGKVFRAPLHSSSISFPTRSSISAFFSNCCSAIFFSTRRSPRSIISPPCPGMSTCSPATAPSFYWSSKR